MVALEPLSWLGSEPVPSIDEDFVTLANDRGWKVGADWSPDWYDEEEAITHPGFWYVMIYREEQHGDEFWHYTLELSPEQANLMYPEARMAFFDLGDRTWQDFCDEQRYPRCPVPRRA